MKRPWQSRTLWFNFIKAALALFAPGFLSWALKHPVPMIVGDAMLNIFLRFLTREKIIATTNDLAMAWFVWCLAGCAMPQQKLDPNTYYKRDLAITVGSQAIDGAGVAPRQTSYNILVSGPGKIDLLTITSCHREFTAEKAASGWIGDHKYSYTYIPVPGIEDTVCPLLIGVYEQDKGRNGWGYLDFETPEYTLPAVVQCNGNTVSYNGTSVCQSKNGLLQRITFPVPVKAATNGSCQAPASQDGKVFEFETPLRECVFVFMEAAGANRRAHRLVTIGYEGVLVRQ